MKLWIKKGLAPGVTHVRRVLLPKPHQLWKPMMAPEGTEETSSLYDFISADRNETLSWHPNRMCAALVQCVASRVKDIRGTRRLRLIREKTFDPISTVRVWTSAPGAVPAGSPDKWTDRQQGMQFFRKFFNLLFRRKRKDVHMDLSRLWNPSPHAEKHLWSCLRRIVLHQQVAPYVAEFSQPLFRNCLVVPQATEPTLPEQDERAEKKPGVDTNIGYGVVMTYNTKLRQNDPDVINVAQSAPRGTL